MKFIREPVKDTKTSSSPRVLGRKHLAVVIAGVVNQIIKVRQSMSIQANPKSVRKNSFLKILNFQVSAISFSS